MHRVPRSHRRDGQSLSREDADHGVVHRLPPAPESKLRPVQAVTDMRYQRSEHPDDLIPAVRHLTNCTACHR